MNETGWITIRELASLIESEIKDKKITVRDGEYILYKAQRFVDECGRKEQNIFKTTYYKYGHDR